MVRSLLASFAVVALVCGTASAQDEGVDVDHNWRIGLYGLFTAIETEFGGGDEWYDEDDDEDYMFMFTVGTSIGYKLSGNLEVLGKATGTYTWGDDYSYGSIGLFGGARWYFTPEADVIPFVEGIVGGNFSEDYTSAAIAGGGGVQFMLSDTTSFEIEYLLNYLFSMDDDDDDDGTLMHMVMFGFNWYF